MKKKIVILLVILIVLLTYVILKIFVSKYELSKLEKYKMKSNETIKEDFSYKDRNYLLTNYYKSDSSYAYNNILFFNKDKYYLLEKIDKCDASTYIKDNNIYIHCIGKSGDILKYTINKYYIEKETIKFNYKLVNNISRTHITITNVDNDYIYLKSVVKKDDYLNTKDTVRCSLSTNICEYY